MHRATFAVGHANLATKKLAENASDSTTSHNGERVTPVTRNYSVLLLDTMFKTNGHGFLSQKSGTRK